MATHNTISNHQFNCIGEGNGNPLQCSCLENPRDGGAWWAAVSGVAQSRTQLKRLSSSSGLIVNGLNVQSKDKEWLNEYKNKTHIYAAYKTLTSDLKITQTESERIRKDIP